MPGVKSKVGSIVTGCIGAHLVRRKLESEEHTCRIFVLPDPFSLRNKLCSDQTLVYLSRGRNHTAKSSEASSDNPYVEQIIAKVYQVIVYIHQMIVYTIKAPCMWFCMLTR